MMMSESKGNNKTKLFASARAFFVCVAGSDTMNAT